MLEYDRKADGSLGQLGKQVVKRRFESFNQTWLAQVPLYSSSALGYGGYDDEPDFGGMLSGNGYDDGNYGGSYGDYPQQQSQQQYLQEKMMGGESKYSQQHHALDDSDDFQSSPQFSQQQQRMYAQAGAELDDQQYHYRK